MGVLQVIFFIICVHAWLPQIIGVTKYISFMKRSSIFTTFVGRVWVGGIHSLDLKTEVSVDIFIMWPTIWAGSVLCKSTEMRRSADMPFSPAGSCS